ncbi:MAG: acetyl-CoA carboxylase biotin carboxylase subunit [Deltaproteobacteria bacterium]|nr:acetyl-CoA carboxylase biotin carboxylase subunit [Deltaproteobacteria bacterium]
MRPATAVVQPRRIVPSLRKVLVANRGEIARRVFRTCREHGIATVAVYSDADIDALHALEADEAIAIGPAPARESYLRVEAIIDAARRSGADGIHPGYGFLSERPALASACDAAGIAFIGPPAAAMDVMGDKVRARKAMAAAGVPVVPGVDDVVDADHADAVAAEIGFPVMIKASAGGGGKGMRVVTERGAVGAAFAAAQREAEASFGDGRVFIERAVLTARHVEIQLMADAFGNCVWLGERDCSVQRRHQKVIEESPSPSLQMNDEVRARMGEVAVRAALAVGYRSAGTVEFLFEETADGPRFYFLEMNTRLQVEHPVTELCCGRDLVWDQLRVAAGEPLGYGQADVVRRGHAVECRIYAEDPVTFLPRPGRVTTLRWPEGGQVRVDAAVAEGSEVSRHYDPMIAKLATWGRDRDEAIARMRRALRETVVLGVETNLALHRRILDEPDFARGTSVTTRYIAEHPHVTEPTAALSERASAHVAAAAAVAVQRRAGTRGPAAGGGATGGGADNADADALAWRHAARWRR